MPVPEGVTVEEQWGVRSDDGEIYRVEGSRREEAERSAQILRGGLPEDEREPGARAARRFVMETPDGPAATNWVWNL